MVDGFTDRATLIGFFEDSEGDQCVLMYGEQSERWYLRWLFTSRVNVIPRRKVETITQDWTDITLEWLMG